MLAVFRPPHATQIPARTVEHNHQARGGCKGELLRQVNIIAARAMCYSCVRRVTQEAAEMCAHTAMSGVIATTWHIGLAFDIRAATPMTTTLMRRATRN